MIVNLCLDQVFVKEKIAKFPEEKVFDVTGILQNHNCNNRVFFARKIDLDHEIERKSVEWYVQAIGELSKDMRKHKSMGISLWWLTSLAEKHDRFHWGQRVFYFFQFLKDRPDLFDKKLTVLLPKNILGLKKFVIDNVAKKYTINTEQQQIISRRRSQLKNGAWLLFRLAFLRRTNCESDRGKTQYVIVEQQIDLVNRGISGRDIEWVNSYLQKKQRNIAVIPWITSLSSKKICSVSNKDYLSVKPSLFDILSIGFSRFGFNAFNGIKDQKTSGKLVFNRDLLVEEFKNVYYNVEYFINYKWVKNYCGIFYNSRFLYTDELYKKGRCISQAIKDASGYGIGIQHGIITTNHTIYRNIRLEVEGDNCLPLPNKILLWNSFFYKNFLFGSDNLRNRLFQVNDLKHKELREKVQKCKIKPKQEGISVLWATTLWEHFVNELEIVQSILMDSSIDLTIRLHPVGHITPEMVAEVLDNRTYGISNGSYEEDLAENDIVLTNSFSTVFYDCFQIGTPVIRLGHSGSFCDVDDVMGGIEIQAKEYFEEYWSNFVKEQNIKDKVGA